MIDEYESMRVQWCKGTRVQGCKGAKVQGYYCARVQVCKSTQVYGSKGSRGEECKSKGAIVSIYKGTEHATCTFHRYMARVPGKGTT